MNILKYCWNVSVISNDIKLVNDFLRLLSKISINKTMENKKYIPPIKRNICSLVNSFVVMNQSLWARANAFAIITTIKYGVK